jgi:phenylacetate-CoA ligase
MDLTALAIRHVLFPLWAAQSGSTRLRHLAELEKSQYWSGEMLAERQWAQFQAMLMHAFETCPYYRAKYQTAGIAPADIRSREDLDRVPTLTKEEIQGHRDEMVSATYAGRALMADMTGGSTGSPMQFHYDRERFESRKGATLRHNRWAGWEIGDRAAILWGAPQDTMLSGRLRDRLRAWIEDRSLMLDAAELSEASMRSFARTLLKYQPVMLQAYANTLGLFAQYVRAERVEGIRPRGIVCSAEVLTSENRRLIEETFGCPVFNRYGCREFAVIASECEAHDGLHINADHLLVEALVDGRSRSDEDGEIVITDLRNFAMPMIRYRIRDVGRIRRAPCRCPRGLPLMDLSGGRVTDFLRTTSGSKVSGVVIATYVITNIPGIRQIQFVQHEPDAVTINLVKGPHWSPASLDELTARARRYLGEGMRLSIEYRDRIAQERSGKYRFSISTLA